MSSEFLEVAEKFIKTTPATSDYIDSKKITEILSTSLNHCNLYLIAVIRERCLFLVIFQRSLLTEIKLIKVIGVVNGKALGRTEKSYLF